MIFLIGLKEKREKNMPVREMPYSNVLHVKPRLSLMHLLDNIHKDTKTYVKALYRVHDTTYDVAAIGIAQRGISGI